MNAQVRRKWAVGRRWVVGIGGGLALLGLLSPGARLAGLGLLALSPWLLTRRQARARIANLRRRPPPIDPPSTLIEVPVMLELLGAALASGASIPRALSATGAAIGGSAATHLESAGSALDKGATWEEAWIQAPARLQIISAALQAAWNDGAAPSAGLSTARETALRERRDAARLAAGRLSVRLVLPLGLCFLPAFILIGLLPVMLSLGGGLLGP